MRAGEDLKKKNWEKEKRVGTKAVTTVTNKKLRVARNSMVQQVLDIMGRDP